MVVVAGDGVVGVVSVYGLRALTMLGRRVRALVIGLIVMMLRHGDACPDDHDSQDQHPGSRDAKLRHDSSWKADESWCPAGT
jgi:hypothetical protein